MATYASRPAWDVKVRAATSAWAAVPAALGLIVLLSVLLRIRELGIGYWMDEGLSVGIADRPVGDIPGVMRQDGSPPLYYVLLHFWIRVFGTS
jgi:mannosyltransferase